MNALSPKQFAHLKQFKRPFCLWLVSVNLSSVSKSLVFVHVEKREGTDCMRQSCTNSCQLIHGRRIRFGWLRGFAANAQENAFEWMEGLVYTDFEEIPCGWDPVPDNPNLWTHSSNILALFGFWGVRGEVEGGEVVISSVSSCQEGWDQITSE